MRKLFWSCAVACVLATGIFLTARHILLQEQETLVGDKGAYSPTLAAAEGGMALAEKLFTSLRGWAHGHRLFAAGKECRRNAKDAAVAVPCEDRIPELPMGGVIELPAMSPDAAPATAIIHEESEVQVPVAPVAHTEDGKDLTMPGSGSTIESPADGTDKKACAMSRATGCGTGKPMTEAPLHMPTCAESETANVTMPQAEEEPAEANDKKEQEDATGSSEDSEASDPMSEATPPNDSPYHHGPESCPYTGCCPYTGRCYPMTAPYTEPQQPSTPKASDKPRGKEETSEPQAPAHKSGKQTRIVPNNLIPNTLPATNESGIDTMEYRPSDGGLNETDGGPF